MSNKIFVRGKYDAVFATLVLVILTIGIITVYSASYYIAQASGDSPESFFYKELIFASSGLVLGLVVSKIDYMLLKNWTLGINIFTIVLYLLLLIEPLGLGKEIYGGRRWLMILKPLGNDTITIMPSEFAKIAGILAISYLSTMKKKDMREDTRRSRLFLFFCPILYIIGTILQPDISTTVVIIVAYLSTLFFAGIKISIVGGMGIFGSFLIGIYIMFSSERMSRIKNWLDPFQDPLSDGYQTLQSLYAISSGGIKGAGIGNGIQKMFYLPLSYNDYIFSAYAEEYGFIGCVILIFLFSMMIVKGFKITTNAPDKFSTIVSGGIITQIAVQAMINMFVSTNTIPSTGIPFPLLSYGGTSLWLTLISLGIVLGISRFEPKVKSKAFDNVENKNYHSLERRNYR